MWLVLYRSRGGCRYQILELWGEGSTIRGVWDLRDNSGLCVSQSTDWALFRGSIANMPVDSKLLLPAVSFISIAKLASYCLLNTSPHSTWMATALSLSYRARRVHKWPWTCARRLNSGREKSRSVTVSHSIGIRRSGSRVY
jgi:hypothetical protein